MTNHKWGGQFGFGSNVRCHLMSLITTIDAPRIHGLTGLGHEHGFREVDRRVRNSRGENDGVADLEPLTAVQRR